MYKKTPGIGTIVSGFLKITSLLSPAHKKKALSMTGLVFLGGLMDVFGIAAIVPIIRMAVAPSIIFTNKYLSAVYQYFNFSSSNTFILAALVSLFLVFVIKNLVAFLITYYQARFSFEVSTELSLRQFFHYYKKDLSFFNNRNIFDLQYNVINIPASLATHILLPSITFVSEFIVTMVIIAGMMFFNFTIFMMLLLTLLPPSVGIYRYVKKRVQAFEKERSKTNIAANINAKEALSGYVDIKLQHKESFFSGRFQKQQKRVAKLQTLIFSYNLLPSKIIELTALCGIILMISLALFVEKGSTNLLNLLGIYVASAYRLMPSMSRMMIAMISIKGHDYAFEILREGASYVPPDTKTQAAQQEKLVFNDRITVQDVSFRYPEKSMDALQHISFEIKKGEKIGFVGKSGSGKTTLINILLRFLEEHSGEIRVDNTRLTHENIDAWRALIGYVMQNAFILHGTVKENIAFGLLPDEIDYDRLNKSIQLAQLESLVNSLPNGLDTNIGDQGAKLSGGQKQRIAIARALYRQAQVLIFDEATSSLDSETEKEITEAIASLEGQDRTIIIIAHRISTLVDCDRIFEMQDGKIARCYNSYNELLQQIN